MIKATTFDFFKWNLLNNKPTTYVHRDGQSYLYCDNQKIDITDDPAEDYPEPTRLEERTGNKLFKPAGDLTMRGILSVQTVPDTSAYIVAFIQEGSKKKRQIVMLWLGDYEKELEGNHES